MTMEPNRSRARAVQQEKPGHSDEDPAKSK